MYFCDYSYLLLKGLYFVVLMVGSDTEETFLFCQSAYDFIVVLLVFLILLHIHLFSIKKKYQSVFH